MLVRERMTTDVKSCRASDSLADAAKLLWEQDCGCVPVTDEHGLVRGMLTDRDICMAAYTTGKRLGELKVGDTMANQVAVARPGQSVHEAEMVMRARGVRRLPVVDEQRRLVGILSCNDLCRWVDDGGTGNGESHDAKHLIRTLATVGRSRSEAMAAEAPDPTLSPMPAPSLHRLQPMAS